MSISLTYALIFIFMRSNVEAENDTDVRNLLMELFTTRSYNKLVRPIVIQSEPVIVDIEFYLYGINDVNEVEGKLTTAGYLEIYWQDEFLEWDPASYGDLQYLFVPQGNVWKPDITLQNGFQNLSELGASFIQVQIASDGYILWQTFQIFESKCNIDVTHFPFDTQTCNLDFVVWSYYYNYVTLQVKTDGINMNEALESNGQWEVISSSSTEITETNESKVQFLIIMKRKPLFVVMNIILPIICLSFLNIFTFQIPADSGERMGYAITVWLAFAVFLTIVSDSLPKSSDSIPIISVYIMIQLGIGTVTVSISAIEARNVCSSDNKQVSSCLRRLALFIHRRSVRPQECDDELNVKVVWKEVIAALDALFFWTFFTCLIMLTFGIMMVAAFP